MRMANSAPSHGFPVLKPLKVNPTVFNFREFGEATNLAKDRKRARSKVYPALIAFQSIREPHFKRGLYVEDQNFYNFFYKRTYFMP